MATQDNNPGLLSKVARFVLNPTKDWDDIGKAEPAASVENSKLALKQMIERKQYNDSVRKREFDKLRKLRQRASSAAVPGVEVKASNFQDSWGPSVVEERTETLKKIDDIEAQMSKQWWKGRNVVPASTVIQAPDPHITAPPAEAQDGAESAFATTVASNLMPNEDEVLTQMGAGVVSAAELAAVRLNQPGGFDPAGRVAVSASKMMSMDRHQGQSDPALEEAAIRFANSDDAGAEAVLLSALKAPDALPDAADAWAAALFDLFLCTHQKAAFDRLALDYAQRFGRSAPIWFSVRQSFDLGLLQTGPALPVQPESGRPVVWHCPEQLDGAAVAQLATLVGSGSDSCCLNWQALTAMTQPAAQALGALFARWCQEPLSLCFEAAPALQRVLVAQTPVSDSQVERFCWQLRLDALRIMRLQDEFELVALDYCLTYEVSPPPWQPARCKFAFGDFGSLPGSPMTKAPAALAAARVSASVAGDFPVLLAADAANIRHFEFSGELLGDAADALGPLQAAAAGGVLRVSCRHLIRVDFSAAGSILNWAAHAQASGSRIELSDVPSLVAVFFNLIGINEHARVSLRTN